MEIMRCNHKLIISVLNQLAYLLNPIQCSDVIKGIKCWRQTSMQTEELQQHSMLASRLCNGTVEAEKIYRLATAPGSPQAQSMVGNQTGL